MPDYLDRAGLQVAPALAQLIEDSILPGLDVSAEQFWTGFAGLVSDLAPRNRALLEERARLQEALDAWHRERRGAPWDPTEYRAFLEEIGYLVPDVPPFEIATVAVDPEIAAVAGPQLVVPVMNPRFALNAANARWGSLYDALYGTDAISGTPQGPGYDPQRGARVVAWAAAFLDDTVPLEDASHRAVTAYRRDGARLVATLEDGRSVGLAEPSQFVGFAQDQSRTSYMMRHHGLHIELVIDPASDVGRESPSGLRDVVLESALTVIQDCEDSVAAVDAEDKVVVYANWLGLMKGDLVDHFEKGGRTVTRRLNPDRALSAPGGGQLTLPGRALMLVRNVGDLMTTDAVRDAEGREIPEAFLDAAVTVLAAMHDLKKTEGLRNSRTGSIYVVKPKMHGPEEAAFADTLFGRVEDMLGLARNTVKLGLMDEERRTSANLRASIRAIKDRIVFINTGFLDRTGDEIHTSMQAGPVIPKGEMKDAPWLLAYEDGNVDAGLAAGMEGRGQIGKGMWAKPDAMAEMIATKQAHPEAGANTAWVPSPTAATLHAVHYHQVDVAARQDALKGRAPADAATLLTPPLLDQRNLSDEAVAREIDNNCQSILGYVVRWIDQGIGCSKVPDINDVALMEDRATLRISAQFLANWIAHGVTSREAVEASLRRMAAAVDRQNAGDPAYKPMAGDPDGSIAFQAARDLIFEGLSLPSGYTEPVLHRRRREAKAAQSAAPTSGAAPKQARA